MQIKHGFNGFSRITRIGSWENMLRPLYPPNLRKSVKSAFNLHISASCVCRDFSSYPTNVCPLL
ncbi:MAG: hypothetical protein FWG87_01435 [Defluviitaleaceae bacterium]|nr:hypothetical protein [Defluviitaleaceae bacterium]